jgi:hypothetical protein
MTDSDELIIQYCNSEIPERDISRHFKFVFDAILEKVNNISILYTNIHDIHISLQLSKITINIYIDIAQLYKLEINNYQNHLLELSAEIIVVDNNEDKICKKIDFNELISQIYIDDFIHIPFVQSNIGSDKERAQLIKFFIIQF